MNIVNGLIRALLQTPTDTDIDYSEMPTLKQFMMGNYSKEHCHPHHIGIIMVYYLHSLREVNQLAKTAKKGESLIDEFIWGQKYLLIFWS